MKNHFLLLMQDGRYIYAGQHMWATYMWQENGFYYISLKLSDNEKHDCVLGGFENPIDALEYQRQLPDTAKILKTGIAMQIDDDEFKKLIE